jgi:hypothetical protein
LISVAIARITEEAVTDGAREQLGIEACATLEQPVF